MLIAAYATLTPREILSFSIELGKEAAELKGGQGKFQFPPFCSPPVLPQKGAGEEQVLIVELCYKGWGSGHLRHQEKCHFSNQDTEEEGPCTPQNVEEILERREPKKKIPQFCV